MPAIYPYILLVTFFSGDIGLFDSDKILRMNESAYNGVAVPLVKAYDTKSLKGTDFIAAAKGIKEISTKNVWPWVFFNRFYGYKNGNLSHSILAKADYFRKIRGLDIYDETGALGDFIEIWRMALKMSRHLNSPGIFADLEAYNNYSIYEMPYLVDEMKRSPEEIEGRLKALGARLSDLAAEECPGCTIWFPFTGLECLGRNNREGGKRQLKTVTQIVVGMLERAREKKTSIVIVSGGLDSLGYCYKSSEDLMDKIAKRRNDFSHLRNRFPNLDLGGTIAPWHDRESRNGWMARGKCKQSSLKGINDFKPLVKHLLNSYRYVWVYAASAAGYNPYDISIARIYDELFPSR